MKAKKFLKGFMTAALSATMVVTPVVSVMYNSLTVFAAPETMPDGTVFDADYYAQTYPDVVNALGTDKDALYNHYVAFGKAEGRMACALTTTVQADKTLAEPSTQSKDPLTARTTPAQALVYADLIAPFMRTDSRPTLGVLRYDTGNGYEIEWGYDAYGNLISAGLSTGYCVSDAEGKIVACTLNPMSKYMGNCFYNEQGQLTQIDGWNYKFYYDDMGRLIKITRYSQDELLYEIRYNEQERTITRSWEKYQRTDIYTYDEQGRLVKKLYNDPDNTSSVTFEYDASGKLIREVGKNSNSKISDTVTEYSYN